MTQYKISRGELKRRRHALTALCLSWLATQAIFSWILLASYAAAAGLFFLILAAVLAVLWIGTMRFFFSSYAARTISLNGTQLTISRGKVSAAYALEDIVGVVTKLTSLGTIRDMTIILSSGKRYLIDRIDGFDDFKRELIAACPSAKHTLRREQFDYDGPAFYPLLGIVLGAFSVAVLWALISFDVFRNVFQTLFAVYLMGIGALFALTHPLEKQYGSRDRIFDYGVGAAMFAVAAIFLALLFAR